MLNRRLLIFLIFTLSFYTNIFSQEDDSVRNAFWEKEFCFIPRPGNLRNMMQLLSARPHHVGSAYDKQNADWILSKFKEWGWDAHIEIFDVLFPTPKERSVVLIEPGTFIAKLQEPPFANDPTSSQQDEQLPTYNAYSIDGDVTAPLVYVNYGIPDDYERLEGMGISVKLDVGLGTRARQRVITHMRAGPDLRFERLTRRSRRPQPRRARPVHPSREVAPPPTARPCSHVICPARRGSDLTEISIGISHIVKNQLTINLPSNRLYEMESVPKH